MELFPAVYASALLRDKLLVLARSFVPRDNPESLGISEALRSLMNVLSPLSFLLSPFSSSYFIGLTRQIKDTFAGMKDNLFRPQKAKHSSSLAVDAADIQRELSSHQELLDGQKDQEMARIILSVDFFLPSFLPFSSKDEPRNQTNQKENGSKAQISAKLPLQGGNPVQEKKLESPHGRGI